MGLLPDKSDKALQRRYQLIQAFLKESKQYGAQRQASEKRVCEIALLNLSRGADYADPMQLTWRMESQQVTDNAAYCRESMWRIHTETTVGRGWSPIKLHHPIKARRY